MSRKWKVQKDRWKIHYEHSTFAYWVLEYIGVNMGLWLGWYWLRMFSTQPVVMIETFFFHHLQFVVGSVAATRILRLKHTVYPKKYAHGFVVLCFVVVTQSFIMNSHEVFINIHQGCFAGTGAIVRLPQCQWSKPDWFGKISQCITTTKHSKKNRVHISWDILYIARDRWLENVNNR